MGPVTHEEKIFGIVIIGMVGLWAGASTVEIPPVVTALSGLAVLFLTGVLRWEDCAANKEAWGTYVSFSCLVGMASMLNKLGVVKWIATSITSIITGASLSTIPAFFVILVLYWLLHYVFASQVAHVSSLYQPFLLMMLQVGVPDVPAVFALAFASNLFATMTPYASAQSAVWVASGYVTLEEWYKVGFVFFVFYLLLWTTVGAVWWKILGLI